MYSYRNGKIIPQNKLSLSPDDLGFLRGYAVFDVMRARGDKPFLLNEHFRRLQKSAQFLNLKLPFAQAQFEKIIKQLLRLNKFSGSVVKTFLSGGESTDGFSIGEPNCFIIIKKFRPLPNVLYEQGARAITIEYERTHPEIKTNNYLEALRHEGDKNKNRAIEIIYKNNGQVFEASTSNLFIVKNKKIMTPRKGVLIGITRNAVVKLARRDFPVVERSISIKDLFGADEVFLTATNKDILPIVKIDGKKIGKGKVGPITKECIGQFKIFLNS